MDRLRTLGRDDGQAATEFIGLLAALALLVALLAASSIAPLVHRSLSSTTCAVLNNPACGSPGSLSPVSLDPPAAAPAEAGEAAPRTFPGNLDSAENNPVDNVFGLVRGVGSQLGEMVNGVVDAVGWGLRSLTSAEQRVENWALWEQIRDHPGESLRAIWDGVKAPIMAEWQAGRPGAAIGRAATEIASLFFGTRGLDKLRALAAANRLDDVADTSRGLAGLRTRLNLADETGAIRLGRSADDYVDLVTPERRRHILEGDSQGGGGHRGGLGRSGKTEFPPAWSDDRIIHEISDVASDPGSTSELLPNGRTLVSGTRDGVDILVVLDRHGNIVTGYPTNLPRNP